MIVLVFEPTYTGTTHAPGNSHLVQIVARALPEARVRVSAEAGHLAELRADAALAALGNVEYRPIALAPRFRGQVNAVSWERFRHEFAMLRAGLAERRRGEPVLILLASSTGTAIAAALLAARLAGGRVAVQVGLHGDLNSVEGWRSANPLARRLDLRGMLENAGPRAGFLVFEPSIARELARLVPRAAGRIDVLPLAVNVSELAHWRPPPPPPPLHIGLVGQTTRAKGIEPFLETARLLRARYGARVAFHIVGKRMPETSPESLADIAEEVPDRHLGRDEFLRLLAGLHYVFLPLQPSYYRLSASGAVLDAVTWLRPMIATRLPIVEDLFAQAGDIGHLCDDVAEMQRVLAGLIETPDPARYARQVEALRRLRETRTPAALAGPYRQLVLQRWPRLAD